MSFLHGGLLGLAGLFSVPLIIHLLNKRRFQVVPWAAMEFLLNAYKRNRRRLRLESLLLLLLRCMIPVLLALAVARPRLSVPEDLPLTKAWQHHIVVLDRSYSMGYIEKNGNRPFERAKQLVAGLIQHGSRVGNDKVSLILVDGSVATTVKGDLDFGRAKRSLDQQEGPRDGVGDLLPALLEARRLVDSEGGAAILYVFSDFQQNLLERETPEEGAAHGAREESAARSGLTGSLAEVRDIFGDLEERGAKVVLV
ncbi:MAG: BatA domain-containing protein, partial [Planctomycetota bacterium]